MLARARRASIAWDFTSTEISKQGIGTETSKQAEWLLVVAASGDRPWNKTKHAPHKLSPCLPRVKAGFVTLCTSRRRLSGLWCRWYLLPSQVRNPSSQPCPLCCFFVCYLIRSCAPSREFHYLRGTPVAIVIRPIDTRFSPFLFSRLSFSALFKSYHSKNFSKSI